MWNNKMSRYSKKLEDFFDTLFGTKGKVFDDGGLQGKVKCGDFADLELKRVKDTICI